MAFLETNASGTGVEAIRKLQHAGYHVLFLTQEIEFYQSLELNPLEVADIVIEVNTNCIGSILNRLANFELHGVVAFDDYRLITAAFVARHLGLPHPSIDGLIHCRFKNLTRQVVSSGNVDYQVCELKAPLDDGTVPYPCVVKPCDDSGSVGVRICQNAEDLHKAVAALKEQRINARGYRLSSQYLIEAFVEGQEYSAELIWNTTSNNWQLLGVTEKHITSGSYAVEVGHDFPVILPEYQEVETTIHGWLNEAGLSHTVAHVEFKLSSHGMALIEINPRPGGDMIHLLCQLSTGIDVVDRYLELLVHGYAGQSNSAKYQAASIRFLVPEAAGIVTLVETPEPGPNIVMSKIKAVPQRIQSVSSSYDRLGFVVAGGISTQAAREAVDTFVQHTRILLEPEGISTLQSQQPEAGWVLLLGNSLKGAKAIRTLGYDVAMIPDEANSLSGEAIKLCRAAFPVKLSNLNAVAQAYDECESLFGPPLTILNFSDAGQLACEWLRDRHGLQGNGVDVAKTIIDKGLMRSVLNQDVHMAVGFVSGTASELLEIAASMLTGHHRYVLKPSDGVGSRDIYFIDGMPALRDALENHSNSDAVWVLEEELPGEEYSVEAVSCDGITRILGITKKYTNHRGVEVGHLYPAPLPEAEQVAIEQTTLKALNLLGVRWGATHTEVMSGSKGVHIIETHLRPGGDEIPELLLLVEEHCQYKLAIEVLISGTLLPTPRHPKGSAAIHFFTHDGDAGYLRSLELTDDLDLFSLELNYKPGDEVPSCSSSFNRIGYVICVSNEDDAFTRCLETAKRLTLSVE
ncbi:ATP-grasp domain-containing protein [Xenorhabdus doucetiae]|uniref:ATP-grasp domain-containing protein n=1 Tax=Xenorhabdus doucetiae TaxID=351671 RepID=UPI00142F382C|nr:ATP-grasp domain-containing protein [Xenorhabdus doucetiae]